MSQIQILEALYTRGWRVKNQQQNICIKRQSLLFVYYFERSKLYIITFTFKLIPLRKVWTLLLCPIYGLNSMTIVLLQEWLQHWKKTQPSQLKGTFLPNKYSEFDIRPSNGEAPVLELWQMWSTLLLLLLPGSLWPRVIAPVRVPSMCQIELFDHVK